MIKGDPVLLVPVQTSKRRAWYDYRYGRTISALMNVPGIGYIDNSYIGYKKTVSLSAKIRIRLKITLTEDSKMIDEVVVVGYGVQRKRDVSTSISSVKAEQICGGFCFRTSQALAGKMPGVQVTPAERVTRKEEASIRVRGISTVNAGRIPLYH